ncbi:MFS transporter [Parasphingorhabdus pacifica]
MFAVGWGANQFAPLLGVYRTEQGLPEAAVTAMFGVYALGLIPSLVVAGRYSDRHGRRGAVRLSLVLSLVASVVLVAGVVRPELLYFGRLLAGVASGVSFSAGSAWVKELSAGAPEGAGARRAALSLSGGFGGGPLIAGAVAQWVPFPEVTPYLVHVLLVLVVLPLAWSAADPSALRAPGSGGPRQPLFPRAARGVRFVWGVAIWAPWVFATVTIGFAVVPTLAPELTPAHPIAFAGALTGLALFTGMLVQPLARRIGRGGALAPTVTGLLMTAGGLGLAALTGLTRNSWFVPLVCVLLGTAYGMLMVSGLREVERLAGPGELGSLAAVFYALIYVGFAAPYLLAVLAPRFGHVECLLWGSLIALAAVLPVVAVSGERGGRPAEPVGSAVHS